MKTAVLILLGAALAIVCMGVAGFAKRLVSKQAVEVGGMLAVASAASLAVAYVVQKAVEQFEMVSFFAQ
jgi:hypothetical protein